MQVYAKEHRETQISNAEGIEYNMKSKFPGIKSEAGLRAKIFYYRSLEKEQEKIVNKEKSQCEIIHNL